MLISNATKDDLPVILNLQHLAYQSEAVLLQNFSIPPLLQTLPDLQAEFERGVVLKAEEDGRIVGSVRAFCEGGTTHIGKLIVDPAFQGRSIGTALLSAVELACSASRYELFTSNKSEKNIRLYERAGYVRFAEKEAGGGITFVYLEKA